MMVKLFIISSSSKCDEFNTGGGGCTRISGQYGYMPHESPPFLALVESKDHFSRPVARKQGYKNNLFHIH